MAKSVAFDGLDHARHWAGRLETAAHLLEHDVDGFLLGFSGGLADNLDDLIAALLELLEQVGRRLCSRLLEVVHQNDALAMLLQLLHDAGNNLLRLAYLEVE